MRGGGIPLQLEVSALLAASTAASAIGLIWSRLQSHRGTGKIQLPTSVEDVDGLGVGREGKDPFEDVVQPEDVVDGVPVEGGEFWKRACLPDLLVLVYIKLMVTVDAQKKRSDGHPGFCRASSKCFTGSGCHPS